MLKLLVLFILRTWKKKKSLKTDWERVYSFVVVLSTDHRNQQQHTRMNINLKSYV